MSKNKINLIITTYASKYSIIDKQKYLKYTLSLLNKINTNITQITIMKAKINPEHEEYKDYYNFNNIEISNIKNKIKIIECENIGISYGQFLNCILRPDNDFDYYIFIEDDYIIFMDNFEDYMINELNKINDDAYLCMFYYKHQNWNLLSSIQNETSEIQNKFIEKLNSYDITKNLKNINFKIPDISTGIISKKSINKILNVFNYDIIEDIFNIKFKSIWIHQILFGYILLLSGINIYDISNKNVNLFYHTGGEIAMFNFNLEMEKWKEISYNEKLDIPIFIPIEFLYPNNYSDMITNNLQPYFINFETFTERYNMLNKEMKNLFYHPL
jgi:hypothetical protein